MSQQATVQDLNADAQSCAAWIARFLKARGVDRVFGLQGGHIQPIWDHCARLGIRIVDVRDEGAAVHMAHAHAELTGTLGVCMATAGPGVTNCVTGIANASLARVPVLLIGGCTSRAQANLGPLQDIPHVEILRPVTRQSRTARVADQVIRELDEAVARAMGDLSEPGPVYIEIPTDVLRAHVPPQLVLDDWMAPKAPRLLPPDPAAVAQAVEVLWGARRPLVVSGRGAKQAGPELVRLLDALGAVYLDTQESRGLVPADHPATVGAMRAAAMTEADVVLVIGRKLDYQLGYGSPAVFPNARFVRIADTAGELVDNRRGEPELLATPSLALTAIVEAAGNRVPALEREWAEGLRARHVKRSTGATVPQTGDDGRVHPAAIFAAIREVADPDYIAVADGGDLLSFARVGLEARTYLDAGAFGCLGVGVPYAAAASLAHPDRQVICVTGDGAFGINAMEIDTAVRHGAKPVIIVSNNAAWNIERYDQEFNYGGRVVGTLLADSDYAGLARALGAHGERVTRPEDLAPAIARALANAPALIDVATSQVAVSSDARKGLGFVPDYQPLTAWDDAERRRRGETV
ncbi:acetolactate synthase [Methylobacterium indicum]|uniref:thiamine pyrophosphate-binding protein n=1 Tax=Methylobacterium indicum TaxID=1775910 RepID=UPI000734D444|nr:thiamine pyrophosphate-binding protein [Methylobacterium indicum]KTS37926.1 acetolactate synthase [Methylobacterium indicum]KTS41950.1 acetolactate synthase [Methylobacterium indicum]KTS45643.1 acetolactate synthase [Methylobacterium indicum]